MASAVPYSPGRLEFTFESDEGFAANVTFCAAVGDTLDGATELALKGLADEFSLYDDKMRTDGGPPRRRRHRRARQRLPSGSAVGGRVRWTLSL